jgi:hydroxymethylpyrimidine pyrophosphatase-like HAD family hydrolase
MDYKMIVLDLDGTLTNSKKEMTPRTRDALLKAEQQGVRIVLASGTTHLRHHGTR